MNRSTPDPWIDPEFQPRLQVDAICRKFERALRAGSDVTIETFLAPETNPFRQELAAELIAIECELKRSFGKSPTIAEYQERFPELSDVLPDLIPAALESVPTHISTRSLDDSIRTLGEFQIVREVGRGGMGVVYEALQPSLRRRVALKILGHLDQLRPDAQERFQREARILATLHHPHIVQAYAIGQQNDVLYLAMEFVNGHSLAQIFIQARDSIESDFASSSPASSATPTQSLSATTSSTTTELEQLIAALTRRDVSWFRRLARIGADIADALAHAHQHEILHRDVKPSNVLVNSEGRSFLTDFGLAKLISDDDGLTRTGDWLGTLRYSAPEVLNGEYDYRSEVYSWGIALYELATLKTAFDKGSRAELVRTIMTSGSPLRRDGMELLAPAFQSILLRATEAAPEHRYQTAREFSDDLNRYAMGQTPHAYHERQARKRRRKIAYGIVGCSLLAVGFFLIIKLPLHSRRGVVTNTAGTDASLINAKNTQPLDPSRFILPSQARSTVAKVYQKFVHAAGVRVLSLDLSVDGETFATGSDDGAIRHWAAKSGKLIRTFSGGEGSVRFVGFTPTGRFLVAATCPTEDLQKFRIDGWNLETQEHVQPNFSNKPAGEISGALSSLQFFQFRTVIETSSLIYPDETESIIWSLQTGGRTLIDLNVAPARVQYVSIRMGGQFISPAVAVVDTTGEVHLREFRPGEEKVSFRPNLGRISGIAYSPQETALACWGDRGVSLARAPFTKQVFLTLGQPPGRIEHVVMDSDDRFAVVATAKTYRLLDLEKLSWSGPEFPLDEPLAAIGWQKMNDSLVLVSQTGRISQVNATTGSVEGDPVEHGEPILSPRWYPKHHLLAFTGESGTAWLYRVEAKQP